MSDTITCGEALIRLLEKYDVDTVFGIPGVHTLAIYRGLADSSIRHVLPRNEAGAGFMADGYARATGKPGVCIVITGPGVTNITTPLGQAYAGSVPLLLISSVNRTESLGKGWGELHESSDQEAITRPLTAMSATAYRTEDVPRLLGQAFSIFASERPRPVHISIPTDVLLEPVDHIWKTVTVPTKPSANLAAIEQSADILSSAKQPVILVGGGAQEATALTDIAELLQAAVITSNAGKGIVPDSHPLSLGCTISRKPTQAHIKSADVVLAIGTELASTDSYVERLSIAGKLIRIDIDAHKINDKYPADIGIVADAQSAADALLSALRTRIDEGAKPSRTAQLADIRAAAHAPSFALEEQHLPVLSAIRNAMPKESMLFGDMTQIVYTGCFAYPSDAPKGWHYAGGFGTLGPALPMAIGAKIGQAELPIGVLVGDGGFMFTVQELMVAVEEKLPIPIILWHNAALGQIGDDMEAMGIGRVAVDPIPPNFELMAQSFGCGSVGVKSLKQLEDEIVGALAADKPTIIIVYQDSDFLL